MKMFELDGKASVGFGLRVIRKGEQVSEDEMKTFPARVKNFFKPVKNEAAKAEPKPEKEQPAKEAEQEETDPTFRKTRKKQDEKK